MEKAWYESKTLWAGFALVALGLAEIVVTGKIDYAGLSKCVAGVGFIGLRTAIE